MGPQNDDIQIQNALVKRCFSSSDSDLDEFVGELSQLLRNSPNDYIPTLSTFTSHLCDDSSRNYLRLNSQKWNSKLSDFASLLITVVIMQNLDHSDTPGFGEFLHNCIELLWKARNVNSDNKGNNGLNLIFKTTKNIFNAILNANAFGILVTAPPGRRSIKRVLFEFSMINRIEQEELLKSVDIIATLVDKCSEHKEVSPRLSEVFSAYKACTALLETLKSHQNAELNLLINRKNSLPPNLNDMVKVDRDKKSKTNRKRAFSSSHDNSIPLSTQDEQHLAILEMKIPQKSSDLPNFLRTLKQRKIDSFRVSNIFFFCFNPNVINTVSLFKGYFCKFINLFNFT